MFLHYHIARNITNHRGSSTDADPKSGLMELKPSWSNCAKSQGRVLRGWSAVPHCHQVIHPTLPTLPHSKYLQVSVLIHTIARPGGPFQWLNASPFLRPTPCSACRPSLSASALPRAPRGLHDSLESDPPATPHARKPAPTSQSMIPRGGARVAPKALRDGRHAEQGVGERNGDAFSHWKGPPGRAKYG